VNDSTVTQVVFVRLAWTDGPTESESQIMPNNRGVANQGTVYWPMILSCSRKNEAGSARRWQKVWCNRAVLSVAIVTVLIALFFILLFDFAVQKRKSVPINLHRSAAIGLQFLTATGRTGAHLEAFAQISPLLQQAVIISEDDTFYQHRGFNGDGARSLSVNWQRKILCPRRPAP
jgi:uncharacterized integral membrane protein